MDYAGILALMKNNPQRLKFADDVIENNSTLEHVYHEVELLNHRYVELALGRP